MPATLGGSTTRLQPGLTLCHQNVNLHLGTQNKSHPCREANRETDPCRLSSCLHVFWCLSLPCEWLIHGCRGEDKPRRRTHGQQMLQLRNGWSSSCGRRFQDGGASPAIPRKGRKRVLQSFCPLCCSHAFPPLQLPLPTAGSRCIQTKGVQQRPAEELDVRMRQMPWRMVDAGLSSCWQPCSLRSVVWGHPETSRFCFGRNQSLTAFLWGSELSSILLFNTLIKTNLIYEQRAYIELIKVLYLLTNKFRKGSQCFSPSKLTQTLPDADPVPTTTPCSRLPPTQCCCCLHHVPSAPGHPELAHMGSRGRNEV